MFIVKKIPLTPNTLWDAKEGKTLCKFSNGVLKTNDAKLVEKLKGMGYEVTGEPDKESDAESTPQSTGDTTQTPPDPANDNDADDGSGGSSDGQTGEPDKESTKPKRRNRKTADK